MPNITENPDYRLVMTFLQNIRPGDMDQESADQLMMIGERMKAGGSLSEREREMLEAVVGNMPSYAPANNFGSMSEGERSYEVDGRMESMSPEMMDSMVSSGQISQGEAGGMAPPPMPSQDGVTYSQSSGVTVAPSNVMTLEEAVAAGIVAPTARPQARPAPMRPQARPMR